MDGTIGRKRTVVVATDEVDVCKSVLAPLASLRIDRVPVASAETAEEWLLDGGADLAVIDVSLGAEVVELVERIRRSKPDTPIVLLTSAAQRQTAARLLDLGAHSYVMKPIYPDEIRAQVERALEWVARIRSDRPFSPARGRSA